MALQTETRPGPALFQIDLSADLGEWTGDWDRAPDAALLELVSSASIACGAHAGDPAVMRRTVAEAARRGCSVGAHPGYPDPQSFGRRELDEPPETVAAQVTEQVAALMRCAAAEGTRVRYVKPHGALYNRAAREPQLAAAVAEAVRALEPSLALLGLAGSALVAAARVAGLRAVSEAFLDRGYAGDGSLLARDRPGAFLDDPEAVAIRAVRLAREGTIAAADGSLLKVTAESCCVHGDRQGAAQLLRAARAALERAGVAIAPFAS